VSSSETPQAGGPPGGGPGAPSEEELRAAYEAELSRITVTDMIAQAVVSLLNIAARRLGRGPGAEAGASAQPGAGGGRDLEQVRDGIDGARALLDILERRVPQEVRPLRDALSQLQMAYAAEVRAAPEPAGGEGEGQPPAGAAAAEKPQDSSSQPGPAESSGRLWVPGR
jgi:hypothetical protein